MVSVSRKDKQVELSISVDVPYWESRRLLFYWDADSELYAGLLTKLIKESFDNKVKAAKREAYEQGWKDAKAKRTKEDWFSVSL